MTESGLTHERAEGRIVPCRKTIGGACNVGSMLRPDDGLSGHYYDRYDRDSGRNFPGRLRWAAAIAIKDTTAAAIR